MNELYRDVDGTPPSTGCTTRRTTSPASCVDQRQEDLLRRRQPQEHDRRRRPTTPQAVFADGRGASRPTCAGSRRFRKPVVAAINGAALGGGLEIALACHHRIAVDDRAVEIGLPEATLGLLPGGGGVTRVVRMLGIQSALMDVLLQGTRFKPARRARRRAWSTSSSPPATSWSRPPRRGSSTHRDDEEAAQNPWDRAGYRMPGGTPQTPDAGGVPAGVPGAAAQADQGRGLPGAAGDPVRRGRGRAGRLRHRERGSSRAT